MRRHRSIVNVSPCERGDGGVGDSWFCLELTSEHVPDEVPPVVVRPPVHGPRARKRRYEDRFPGTFEVVETVVERFPSYIKFVEPVRFNGIFALVETVVQNFDANFTGSTAKFTRLREEESLILLLMDEE